VGLVNSLYQTGFRGNIYAGYRGDLPRWAQGSAINCDMGWLNAKSLHVAQNLDIHFLPIETHYHLSHYKPDFMLQLLNGPARDVEFIAYFDPDIINLCKWSFYEKWMSYGIAMVHEIVSNDMPSTHPSRMEWFEIIKKIDREPRREIHSYINAGFCGVARKNIEFLHLWSQIVKTAIKDYKMDAATFITYDRTSAFYCIDQDSFNIAAMCCESQVSEMGPEAMDFVGSGWTMSHAAGWPKPWKNGFLISALKGNPPSRPHKSFWKNISEPIALHTKFYISFRNLEILLATFISRFYRRS
jgi:hypothetical protein